MPLFFLVSEDNISLTIIGERHFFECLEQKNIEKNILHSVEKINKKTPKQNKNMLRGRLMCQGEIFL